MSNLLAKYSIPITTALATIAGCSNGEVGRSTSNLGENGLGENGLGLHPRPGDAGGPGSQPPEAGTPAKGPGLARSTVSKRADASATIVPCADAGTEGQCADPTLGVVGSLGSVGFVSLTGTVVNGCMAGNTAPCNSGNASTFLSPSDVALDYGNFPFSRERAGEYFFAVVAAGYEKQGFFQGAPGNLSDTTPSAVAGDLGSGDALADRNIVVLADQVVTRFPTSSGTHQISFPPSQFVTIQLAPFDTTPEGKYVLAVCPTNAKSRCDCAFDAFSVVQEPKDAGRSGTGGTGGSGGAGGGDAATHDSSTPGSGGSPVDSGTSCHDM